MIVDVLLGGAVALLVAVVLALRANHRGSWLVLLVAVPITNDLVALNVGGAVTERLAGAIAILVVLLCGECIAYFRLLARRDHPAPIRRARLAALGTVTFTVVFAAPLFFAEFAFVCLIVNNGCG